MGVTHACSRTVIRAVEDGWDFRCIAAAGLGIALASGIDRAVMAQPADLPTDTTIYQEDDGDDCPDDPSPIPRTSAGLEV